jgi:hypothetical protein
MVGARRSGGGIAAPGGRLLRKQAADESEGLMNRKRRGQTALGTLVVIVILGLLTAILGGSTAYLALKEKKDLETEKKRVESVKPYVELDSAGSIVKPNAPAHRALIEKMESAYQTASAGPAARKLTVPNALLLEQEKLIGKLVGKVETFDTQEILVQVAQAYRDNLKGMILKTKDRPTGRDPIGENPGQVVHLSVKEALECARLNYQERVAEIDELKKKLGGLEANKNYADAVRAVKVKLDGKETTIAEYVDGKKPGADAADYVRLMAEMIKVLQERADAADAKAAAFQQSLAAAQTAFDEAKNKFVEDVKKQEADNQEKQNKLNEDLTAEKQSKETEVAKRDGEIATLKRVLTERLRMIPDNLRADLILRPAGTVSQVNKQRRTVLLSINTNIRNKVLPGYRFGVYGGDAKSPMVKESLKGKVEVVSVSGAFAEARLVPGEQIKDEFVEGDRIGNPFVDRQVRHVALIGYFDLDGDSVPTPEETDQLRKMIINSGGIVDDELVETSDFAVFGFIPVEAVIDPKDTDAVKDKKTRDNKIVAAKKRADELTRAWAIPVLNQNRLFDLIGVMTRKDDTAAAGY